MAIRLTKKGKAVLVIFFCWILPMILLVMAGMHASNVFTN